MYNDWLKNLKVGDLVLTAVSSNPSIGRAKVSEITPSGLIRVNDELYNGTTGRKRGSAKWFWSYIEEYQEERWQQELGRRNRIEYLRIIQERNLRDLPTVTLQAIVTIIESDAAVQEAEKVLDKTAQM